MRLKRLNVRSRSFTLTTDPVIHRTVFLVERAGTVFFFIERDETDREQYLKKIPFRSFERDGISQKLNLTHA
jgi:hypothetical protein